MKQVGHRYFPYWSKSCPLCRIAWAKTALLAIFENVHHHNRWALRIHGFQNYQNSTWHTRKQRLGEKRVGSSARGAHSLILSRISGKRNAKVSGWRPSKAGWLNPGVSASRPPETGRRETFLVVCFPLPIAETSPTSKSLSSSSILLTPEKHDSEEMLNPSQTVYTLISSRSDCSS